MELRDKIPVMSFVKINIINILAKGIKLIILSEGIIKLQHSEAVVKNSQWHKWQYNHLGNYVMWMKSIAIFNTHGLPGTYIGGNISMPVWEMLMQDLLHSLFQLIFLNIYMGLWF